MSKRSVIRFSHLVAGFAVILAISLVGCCPPTYAMTANQPFNDVTTTTKAASNGVTLDMPGSGHALYNLTFSQNATMVIAKPTWAGQTLTIKVCQDSTGGWTPAFGQQLGVTLHIGAIPFTTTANKCDIVGILYPDLTTAYLTGYMLNK